MTKSVSSCSSGSLSTSSGGLAFTKDSHPLDYFLVTESSAPSFREKFGFKAELLVLDKSIHISRVVTSLVGKRRRSSVQIEILFENMLLLHWQSQNSDRAILQFRRFAYQTISVWYAAFKLRNHGTRDQLMDQFADRVTTTVGGQAITPPPAVVRFSEAAEICHLAREYFSVDILKPFVEHGAPMLGQGQLACWGNHLQFTNTSEDEEFGQAEELWYCNGRYLKSIYHFAHDCGSHVMFEQFLPSSDHDYFTLVRFFSSISARLVVDYICERNDQIDLLVLHWPGGLRSNLKSLPVYRNSHHNRSLSSPCNFDR